MQIGFTGLVNAAQQYTRKDGATFATYVIRAKGAIIDYLRKSSNLRRTTIQIKKKYNKVVQSLQTKLMRQPTQQEIATDMGMSEYELHEWNKPFRRTRESLGDVYDQYSIWHGLKKTAQKKSWAMKN